MNVTHKRGAIFDMDGVLVDNMRFHENAFYEFGRRHGIEITPEFFHGHITGNTNERIMPKIFGNGLSVSEIKILGEEKEAIYREMYLPHLKPTEGLMEYLLYLQQQGIGMAIASNAPMENIRFVAEALNLGRYFSYMLNGDSVPNPKPAPDMFLKCAQLLGATPENCIVFEDAPGGIRGTHAAGMQGVVLLTSHTKEEFEPSRLYVHDFGDPQLYELWA